jgi:hypothetical protein
MIGAESDPFEVSGSKFLSQSLRFSLRAVGEGSPMKVGVGSIWTML